MGLDILFDTDGAVLTKPLVSLPVDAAREANHRIANVLTLLSSSVRLQATNAARKTELTGSEVRLLLAKIAAQIEAAGQLHKWLCNGTAGKEMGLNEYLHKLCAGLEPFASFVGPAELICQVKGNATLRPDQVVPLALVICEMISNSIKHAHPAGAPGVISVYGSGEESFTMVEIADDGVGFPENFDPKTGGGLGLQLVRSVAKQLGATLVFDSDSLGLRFQLFLPKHPAHGLS